MRTPALLALPTALLLVSLLPAQRGGRAAVNVGGPAAPPAAASGLGTSAGNPVPRTSTQPRPPAPSATGKAKSASAPVTPRAPRISEPRALPGRATGSPASPRANTPTRHQKLPKPVRRATATPAQRWADRRSGTPLFTNAESAATESSAVRILNPVSLTLDSITADPEEKARAREVAAKFRGSEITGGDVVRSVAKLKRLEWHGTMTRAAQQARAEDKPIVWVQALGDLTGFV